MKKIFFLFFIVCIAVMSTSAQTPGIALSKKIAEKMKDTLALNNDQKEEVFGINMHIHQQKMSIRRQPPGNKTLNARMQEVENTRDSLYREALTNPQYLLYLQKKENLVNND